MARQHRHGILRKCSLHDSARVLVVRARETRLPGRFSENMERVLSLRKAGVLLAGADFSVHVDFDELWRPDRSTPSFDPEILMLPQVMGEYCNYERTKGCKSLDECL